MNCKTQVFLKKDELVDGSQRKVLESRVEALEHSIFGESNNKNKAYDIAAGGHRNFQKTLADLSRRLRNLDAKALDAIGESSRVMFFVPETVVITSSSSSSSSDSLHIDGVFLFTVMLRPACHLSAKLLSVASTS